MRRTLVFCAIAVLLVSVFTPSPVNGRPATAVTTTYTGDTMTYLRNNFIGKSIGPNRATGYGQATIRGFVKAPCAGCNWYTVTLSITNHQPTASANTASPNSGFCWPWEDGLFSGNSCWNNINSWDWPFILRSAIQNPINQQSTWDRVYGCYKGTYTAVTGSISKSGTAALMEVADSIKISPFGTTIGVVVGCMFNMVH